MTKQIIWNRLVTSSYQYQNDLSLSGKMFPLYARNDNSNKLLGVFRPIYICARIHGLFPFRVNMELNKPFVTKVDSLIFALHILLYAGYAFLNIYCDTNKFAKVPTVLEIGNRINLICGILSGIVVIVLDLLNRKSVWKIFHKFESFDRMVLNIVFRICRLS